ncbi:NYN domain-containing protein [Yoonia sp. R2-816]|uniref:NYN domain-containing protein n=1 Tax=Yoonia sp. R2-816 TaxID=3342638 RepID=UPI00372C5A72
MRFLEWLVVCMLVLMVVSAVVLPENADKARIIDGIGKGVFASFGLVVLGYLWRRRAPRKPGPAAAPILTGELVIVDGSNVMHWSGEPSLKVLFRVLKELEKRGLQPHVYFDANVGYTLFDRHVEPDELAEKLGLSPVQVTLAPSRTTADQVLLERAVSDGLRVVTNDRFLDWKQRFPKVAEKGFLIKGIWKEGSVILLGLGRA